MSRVHDLAVVGLGAVGSAALWRAAARGARVIGIDRFEPPHPWGSSHGGSRIFRRTLFEGAHYVPVARRARELWRELEATSGTPLLRTTGGLVIGPDRGDLVTRALASAEQGGVDVEVLDEDQLGARFPQHGAVAGDIAVLEPGAGVLDPEACIAAALDAARGQGAELRTGARISSLDDRGDEVRLSLEDGTGITARRVILSTGAWIQELAVPLGLPVGIQRSPLVWFTGPDRAAFAPDRFPTFVRVDERVDCWGIPDVDGRGVKIGVGQSRAAKPWLERADDNRRAIDERDTSPVETAVAVAFPGLRPRAAHAEPCMNSRTPDRDFLLGIHPDSPGVVMAGGFSGHGFKHATGSAELAVDLALEGTSAIPHAAFAPDRFGRDSTVS